VLKRNRLRDLEAWVGIEPAYAVWQANGYCCWSNSYPTSRRILPFEGHGRCAATLATKIVATSLPHSTTFELSVRPSTRISTRAVHEAASCKIAAQCAHSATVLVVARTHWHIAFGHAPAARRP